MESYAEELAALRIKARLDQKDVPDKLKKYGVEVSPRSYQAYETGEYEPRGERKKDAILQAMRKIAGEAGPSGDGSGRPGNRPTKSVKEELITPETTILFTDLETDEPWFSIEIHSRVVVHKVKHVGGRRVGRYVESRYE